MTAKELTEEVMKDTIKYLGKKYKLTEFQALQLLKSGVERRKTKNQKEVIK